MEQDGSISPRLIPRGGTGGDKWVPADWGNTPITPRLNMVVTPMLRFTHSSASGDGEARRQNATGKWAGR